MVYANDVAQKEYRYIGMAKVVENPAPITDQPTDAVCVKVLAVENLASTLVNIGQVVFWPKANLALQRKEGNSQSNADLGIMLMQLNDTEKEGDGERCLRNWKLLMLYFRSRNRGMKYAFEAMRLLTCTKALFTEQIAHRIIYGQFMNAKGGPGNNY